jgi:hypothetical protein
MYAFSMDVGMPVEMYQRVSAELSKELGGSLPEGCLMHLATRTGSGFRVTEVWQSHEQSDRFGDQVMRPLIERIAGPEATAGGPPPSQELDVLRFEIGRQSVTV